MDSLLSNYTTKELQKKLKTQKKILIIQNVVLFLMILLAVFSTIENGISFQTFLPLFFIPMSIVMILEVKKIKKELHSRT